MPGTLRLRTPGGKGSGASVAEVAQVEAVLVRGLSSGRQGVPQRVKVLPSAAMLASSGDSVKPGPMRSP